MAAIGSSSCAADSMIVVHANKTHDARESAGRGHGIALHGVPRCKTTGMTVPTHPTDRPQ
jgi:hypothetical protein